MIAIKADDATREQYVSNIIDAYNAATPAQRAKGEQWYQVAHDLAQVISGGNARAGAGVLAALSANTGWDQNQELARRAYVDGRPSGHFGDALRKAERIMLGEDPEAVLPMDAKTGHFFRCIADPTDPDPVVIDRHAHDIAVGETYGQRDRGLSSLGRYALLAHCYREAAHRLGIIQSELQAVTWVAHTQRIAGTGTRGQRHKVS